MVQCGGWVLASLHNPVLMRTYALGFFEGVFYSEYLHIIWEMILKWYFLRASLASPH